MYLLFCSTVNKRLSVNTTSVASQNEQDLLTLYVQGMNNYSSDLGKSLLRLASDKTGLSEREVKVIVINNVRLYMCICKV